MNRHEYEVKREELLNQAQALIDSGKLDEFDAKKAEIETLDAKFDTVVMHGRCPIGPAWALWGLHPVPSRLTV